MRSVLFAGVAAAALLVGSAAPSQASLMLELDSGLATGSASSLTGIVTFNGGVGNFVANVTTGVSKPLVGSATQPILDLNSIDINAGAGGTLTLKLTDTDFLGSGSEALFLDAVGGTLSSGTIEVATYMDCSDTAFGTGTKLTDQTFGTGAFSGTPQDFATTCSGAYSLTQIATLTMPGGGLFSGDSSLSIPEPSTLALFGVGLLGLGFGVRCKYSVARTDSGKAAA